MVEQKQDVVILLDPSPAWRALHAVLPRAASAERRGRLQAMHKPKRFFGAARNVEEGGSLTIGPRPGRHRLAQDEVSSRSSRARQLGDPPHRKMMEKRIFPCLDSTAAPRARRRCSAGLGAERVWHLRQLLHPLNVSTRWSYLLDG